MAVWKDNPMQLCIAWFATRLAAFIRGQVPFFGTVVEGGALVAVILVGACVCDSQGCVGAN